MSDLTDTAAPVFKGPPTLPKWPFLAGDLLLLGLAAVVYWQGGHPPFGDRSGLLAWEAWVLAACCAVGAWISITPFLLEYRAWSRMAEIDRVDVAVEQIRNLDQLGRQIGSATSSWQAVQGDAAKVMQAAQDIQQQMSAEARAFGEFMQKSNEAERQHLRLEVEKLRRAENEWLQVTVRILDHVYALHQAAVRSGRVNLVEQFSHFQRVCRDAAQRIGLVPYVAKAGELFDPTVHQAADPVAPDNVEPKVTETLATGFRFQGHLIRKALVVVPGAAVEPGTAVATPPTDPAALEPVPVPAGPGQTELTERLTSGLHESGDTEFVREIRRGISGPREP